MPRIVHLSDLPPISNNRRFYSSYDASLQDIIWHDVEPLPQFIQTIVNRPRWFHPEALFDRSCPHTKYLHALFLQCPISNWRPITRSMIVQFSNALVSVDPSVAQSIKLYHSFSEMHMDEMCIAYDENNEVDSCDESATITSEDSAGNEVLILFRFWVNANPKYYGHEDVYEDQIRGNSKFAKKFLKTVMDTYDDDRVAENEEFTELMVGPIIEVPMTTEQFDNIEHTDFPTVNDLA
jgi:hypothetical protein